MSAIIEYIKEVDSKFSTGIAGEHAYRPALQTLLEAADEGLNPVNDPKRIDIGMPDFQVLHNKALIGIVEAKDVGVDLDKVEKSEQMQRYFRFGNVILTNYLEFRWYKGHELREKVRIAEIDGKHIRDYPEKYTDLEMLLRGFAQEKSPQITSSRELAENMAQTAQQIRHYIEKDLGSDSPSIELTSQMEAFQKTLLPGLDIARFADMIAQTVAYGLFAARMNHSGDPATFDRYRAAADIPRTNPFLRKLFHGMEFDLGERVTWLVDKLADTLQNTATNDILQDFGKKTRQEDPVVHFYETFLSRYDPKMRERRGVYYTPEPVVSYIVRSVDHILKTRFNRPQGLADKDTLVLDPATGTGTFLYFVTQHIYEQIVEIGGQKGMWSAYVRDNILPRLFGFELLVAPYTVAHMKLGLQLQETGYDLSNDQRLGIYLTNTLEEVVKSENVLFANFIAEEANEAASVKRDKPIMVILGNPPYSGHSANRNEKTVAIKKGSSYVTGWELGPSDRAIEKFSRARKDLKGIKQPTFIGRLIRDYFFVDGKPLGERNPKWLNNDYVKFIRFGQWKIEKTGSGILAFITDNSYLDSVTFRGMRQQLMQTFTEIYIVDLHGNARKKEISPDGSPDDNVFDIMQGVSIAIFIKKPGKNSVADVYHIDLWGKRKDKYKWLNQQSIEDTDWEHIKPQSPHYLFVPQDITSLSEYQKNWQITDIIPLNSVGIVTGQDSKAVAFTKEKVRELLRYYELGMDIVQTIYYRPFDLRHIIYHPSVVTRQRLQVMRHFLSGHDNLALITSRMTKGEIFRHVQITENIAEVICMSPNTSNNGFVFPLYLYPKKNNGELFPESDNGDIWPLSDKGRRPNLNPVFVKEMESKLGLQFITDGTGDCKKTFGPEDIFHYAYAVFHSPTYRERYAEFLKIDFPRLPLTADVKLFKKLCKLGAELVQLHLMKSPKLAQLMTTYPEDGDNVLPKKSGYPKYDNGKVYINKAQYFDGVPQAAWDFHVGGYQVLHKWLKDRKGRELSFDDLQHYQQVVVALSQTMRIMEEIDETIPDWPLE